MARAVQGLPPRVCLLEVGLGRCAALPDLPQKNGWSSYTASLTPDPNTQAIDLLLYADANGDPTVAEYANVQVSEVPGLPSFVLLHDLGQPTPPVHLVVMHSSFSNQWKSNVGEHVLTDGMLNGWLVPSGSRLLEASYGPANELTLAQLLSVIAGLVALGILVWPWASGRFRRIVRLPTADW